MGGCYAKGSEADARDARWWGAATQRAAKLMLMMLVGHAAAQWWGAATPRAEKLMLMMLVGQAAAQRAPPS